MATTTSSRKRSEPEPTSAPTQAPNTCRHLIEYDEAPSEICGKKSHVCPGCSRRRVPYCKRHVRSDYIPARERCCEECVKNRLIRCDGCTQDIIRSSGSDYGCSVHEFRIRVDGYVPVRPIPAHKVEDSDDDESEEDGQRFYMTLCEGCAFRAVNSVQTLAKFNCNSCQGEWKDAQAYAIVIALPTIPAAPQRALNDHDEVCEDEGEEHTRPVGPGEYRVLICPSCIESIREAPYL